MDVVQNICRMFHTGSCVNLLAQGEIVAIAQLCPPTNMDGVMEGTCMKTEVMLRDKFARCVGAHKLSDVEQSGQVLVMVRGVHAKSIFTSMEYPYKTPGVSKEGMLLGDLDLERDYSWDLRSMAMMAEYIDDEMKW